MHIEIGSIFDNLTNHFTLKRTAIFTTLFYDYDALCTYWARRKTDRENDCSSERHFFGSPRKPTTISPHWQRNLFVRRLVWSSNNGEGRSLWEIFFTAFPQSISKSLPFLTQQLPHSKQKPHTTQKRNPPDLHGTRRHFRRRPSLRTSENPFRESLPSVCRRGHFALLPCCVVPQSWVKFHSQNPCKLTPKIIKFAFAEHTRPAAAIVATAPDFTSARDGKRFRFRLRIGKSYVFS